MSQLDILEMEVMCGMHKTAKQREVILMLEQAESMLTTLNAHLGQGVTVDWTNKNQLTLEWLINEAKLRDLDAQLARR